MFLSLRKIGHKSDDVKVVQIPLEKRVFDVIIGMILLMLFLPFFLFTMVLIFIEGICVPSSRGGFFYSETRISEGKPFTLYKFRIFKIKSLRNGGHNEKNIQTKKLEHDERNLTHIGKVLRKIYMDELPQLVNVLKGEMTMVGPRPTNIENAAQEKREGKLAKQLIRAGLTGYFQSHKGTKFKETQNDIDMRYVNFVRSNPGWRVVWYDATILFVSILTVLRAEGI